MPHSYLNFLCRPILAGALAAGSLAGLAEAQRPGTAPGATQPLDPKTEHVGAVKAGAYYHFSMGHLYEELAAAYGNRSDYVNKAIDNYRLAMKEDPGASFLVEDIAELYRMSGHIREAVEEAQAALKVNDNDLDARRVLAKIYTQEIGDAQTKHVDEAMAHRAIEQYKIITDKNPKDTDSLVMLGRLDNLVVDSVGAEAAFKKALAAEPDNEDAVTGLASVYAERNDPKAASELLQKLTTKAPTPRSLVALANSYEQLKEYSLAADAYEKAIDLDPSRVELKGALAQDQALAGRYDDAIKTFGELAEANPQEAMPYLGMSQIYREQKNLTKARESLEKAKQVDPDNLDVRLEDARVLDAEGRVGDAITVLKSVIDTTNRRNGGVSAQARAELLDSLGALYRTDRQFDRAVDTFREAATVNTSIADREEVQIIETYRGEKDYTKAAAESDVALKKFPDNRMLAEVRAEVYSDTGKTDDSVAVLRKLLDGKNDREIYLAIADSYEKGKNFAEMGKALDSADKLSSSKDERAYIQFMRGSMYERQKRFDLAERQFRAALDIDPKNASALNYLGYMLADQGTRLQEAQDLIKQAVTLEPNNYAYLDSLGWVYYRQNRLDDAEQQLRRSVQMGSNDPTVHDHLGDVYFKEGKLKEAIDQWQSSLNAWGTSAPAELEPDEMSKVQKKLESARVRLAKEQSPSRNQ